MPIQRFWLMLGNIDRVSAYEKLGDLDVAVCSQNAEAYKEFVESLKNVIGMITKTKEEEDTERYQKARDLLRNIGKRLSS